MRWLGVYARGLCMGAADAVPGVSGGTIALITGIYERLISALTAIEPGNLRTLLGSLRDRDRAALVGTLREMDVQFLLVLGAGVITAVVAVTRVIEVAVHDYPVPTFAFFAGLIAASALVLYGEVDLGTRETKVAALGGFLLAFTVADSTTAALGPGLLAVFVAGAVAVTAMVLPGVSGSLLLIILGMYTRMVTELQGFVEGVVALVREGSTAGVREHGAVVVTFVLGAVLGLFTVAHAVKWALEHRRKATLAFLVSLIVGGLRAPAERILAAQETWAANEVASLVGFLVLGAAAVVLLDRYAGAISY